MKFLPLSLLAISLLCSSGAFANTATFEGDSAFEWHFGPPTLWISGDSAAAVKRELGYSKQPKKVTAVVSCKEYPGATPSTTCTISFPQQHK